VKEAIAIGVQRKFCSMLIFPDLDTLYIQGRVLGIELPPEELIEHPKIIKLYQDLIDVANQQLPSWSNVKSFQLMIDFSHAIEQGMLNQTLNVRCAKANRVFAKEINLIYAEI
jgi:long-chain acyl-CoA synthetase